MLVDGRDDAPGRIKRWRARTAADAPEIDQVVLVKGVCRTGEFARVKITRAEPFALHARAAGGKGAGSLESVV